MDDDVRIALADLTAMVQNGFARTDRYFELQQKQFIERFAEIRGDIEDLRGDIRAMRLELTALNRRVETLENEFHRFRDWATREIAAVRVRLSSLESVVLDLRTDVHDLRSDVAQLSDRVARLESQLTD